MNLFAWKPEYSVGAPVIDTQHQKLFRMADELHLAMAAGKGKDQLRELLDALIAYTCEHFATEEAMMHKAAYPGFAEHHRQHEDLKRQVIDFQKQMAANQAVLTVDVMEFLSNWLRHHIKGSDQKLASFISKAPAH
jgi:hemerythrin